MNDSNMTPLVKNPVSGLTAPETDALAAFHALIAAGAEGGPLLVKLWADLEKLIANEAEFPELVSRWASEGDDEGNWVLHCPTCDTDVSSMFAVDRAERETEIDSLEGDPDAAPGETQGVVEIYWADRGEFGDTLYFVHGLDAHPVSLPSSWEII